MNSKEILTKHGTTDEYLLKFNALNAVIYDKLETCDLRDRSKYHVPQSKMNGAYDSLWFDGKTLHIFQITVAKLHTIKLKPMEDLLKFAKSKKITEFKFTFIVPFTRFEEYKKSQDIVGVNNTKVKKTSDMMKEIEKTQYVVALRHSCV